MIDLRVLSIAVAVALGMLGAVQLAAPEALGISPVAARWLGIVAAGLGILQGFLPRVQGPTKDPEALADHLWGLDEADRELVIRDIEDRARRAALRHATSPTPPRQPDPRLSNPQERF